MLEDIGHKLDPRRFGCRKGRSTTDALVSLLDMKSTDASLPTEWTTEERYVAHEGNNSVSTPSEVSVFPNLDTGPRTNFANQKDPGSNRKITVRLGVHVALFGPREFLVPELLLALYKEPILYSLGEKKGVLSLRITGIRKSDL
ncbi:hypothetical protein J4Q44_G00097590 [Coregonus suidteri]|uniref:Uncharacterized protein n=1 Tax=Coregonus suidteri TaxID=861788 RepID=A0AAN8M7C1_9TELE